ncbi:hypothetical protein CEXT_436081 [Caerostris extrusa]|uniref:Uncharacterized protein n=1 Tax=Caerostris extrusa TaxID=172846 RepID=A0AAV4MPZ6_CAEEX|nr:hypothetical protein CEXT_436081 [Caerostris extrusa]
MFKNFLTLSNQEPIVNKGTQDTLTENKQSWQEYHYTERVKDTELLIKQQPWILTFKRHFIPPLPSPTAEPKDVSEVKPSIFKTIPKIYVPRHHTNNSQCTPAEMEGLPPTLLTGRINKPPSSNPLVAPGRSIR